MSRPSSPWRLASLLLALACVAGSSALAEVSARRDPTQPPASGAQPASVPDPADGFRPEQVVTVDGRRYLVVQGRRYGVGDTVRGARIERLDENEVWLRTGQGLRRLPMYRGIEKTKGRTP